jgi:hypothetical protein
MFQSNALAIVDARQYSRMSFLLMKRPIYHLSIL